EALAVRPAAHARPRWRALLHPPAHHHRALARRCIRRRVRDADDALARPPPGGGAACVRPGCSLRPCPGYIPVPLHCLAMCHGAGRGGRHAHGNRMSTQDPRPAQLRRMKAIALARLLASGAGFATSHVLGNQGAWAWVSAFCEAATVGALADWFAVVALFRRPLGLPIPHTAIVPRSKARIADSLAAFVRDHFLE